MKPLTWSLATPKERSFYFCAVFGFLGLFEGFLAAGVFGLGGLLLAGRGFAFAGVISGLWGLAAFGPRDGASTSHAGNGAAARRAWRTAALACILAAAVPLLAATDRPFILASLFAAAGLGAALGRRARRELYAAAGKFGEGPLGPPLHLAMAGAGTVAGALLLGAVLRLRRGADDAAALAAAFSFLWFPALLSALGTFLARRIEKKGLDTAPRSGDVPADSPPRRPLKNTSSFLFGLGLMNPMLIESVIQNGKRIPLGERHSPLQPRRSLRSSRRASPRKSSANPASRKPFRAFSPPAYPSPSTGGKFRPAFSPCSFGAPLGDSAPPD